MIFITNIMVNYLLHCRLQSFSPPSCLHPKLSLKISAFMFYLKQLGERVLSEYEWVSEWVRGSNPRRSGTWSSAENTSAGGWWPRRPNTKIQKILKCLKNGKTIFFRWSESLNMSWNCRTAKHCNILFQLTTGSLRGQFVCEIFM